MTSTLTNWPFSFVCVICGQFVLHVAHPCFSFACLLSHSLHQKKGYQGVSYEMSAAVVVGLTVLLIFFVFHCTWVTSTAYSSPSIVLAAQQPDGSRRFFDDFREVGWSNYFSSKYVVCMCISVSSFDSFTRNVIPSFTVILLAPSQYSAASTYHVVVGLWLSGESVKTTAQVAKARTYPNIRCSHLLMHHAHRCVNRN